MMDGLARLTTVSASAFWQRMGELRFRSDLARKLSPKNKVRIIVGAEIALTVVLAFIAGRLVWTMFAPPAWAPEGDVAAVSAPKRPANPGLLAEIDPFHRASSIVARAAGAPRAPETMLDLQLYGIRADEGSSRGSAIVSTPDNIQNVFSVGQEIMPGVRLEQVLPDRIVIRRNGVLETLSFDREANKTGAQPVAVASATQTTQGAEEPLRRLDVSVQDFASLLRFSPAERNGVRGLLLEGSADASLLQQTGLEPGDLLVSVNGTPATDTSALAALAAAGTARLSLEIERKGQRKFHRLAIDRTQ